MPLFKIQLLKYKDNIWRAVEKPLENDGRKTKFMSKRCYDVTLIVRFELS